ncbi:O-antigen translocase [bacterium]|nr:O-antigen translocase [bacterium]MBU1990832.1 O-antigen translocase [bacterium]
MTLIKTSILSAIATVIKIISGFIITKVIAVYVGPAGLAMIGQLQNFINIVLMFCGDFLKTATTKYTAEYTAENERKYQLWSSSVKIIFFLNLFGFFCLFFFSEVISAYLLKDTQYGYVLKVLAFSIPFFVLNTMLLAILNGHKQIKKYIILNIVLSLISLALVVVLSVYYGLNGALIAYVINQSVVFFVTLVFVKDEYWFKLEHFFYQTNKEDMKKLLGFAMITLAAVLSSNGSLIYIRDFISETISMESAGHWQGIWGLSQISLTLITTSLATYFLPTLSALKNKHDISKELKSAIKIIVPLAFLISLTLYVLRDFIILLLYTEDFLPMNELFLWQMTGNVIKVCGWMFGYVLVARAMIKYTVFTEILFALTFIGLSVYFTALYGLVGVTYAYALNSLIHFFAMYYIYKYKIN